MRVMRVLTRPNLGGPARQAVALWHALADLDVRTLLVVGACRAGETAVDLAGAGIPRIAAADVTGDSAGFVELAGLDNRFSLAGSRTSRRELRTLVARHGPDVVHTHTSKAGWLGRSVARAAGVPVVAHSYHGHVLRDYFGPLRSWLLRSLERRLAARTDVLVAVSESCAVELAEIGVAPRSRLQVVPPAVAPQKGLDRQAARAALGLAADAWVVACIGRLVPIKRVDRFVEAIAGQAEVRGHVVGDGPLRAALTQQAAGLDRLEFRGADADVRRYLAAYDAVVIPSVREGCPLVAVEAFGAGVPVVGFDVPGVSDVLDAWGAGLTVAEASGPAGLGEALAQLRGDRALRERCVAGGRANLQRFLPEEVAKRLLASYRAALTRP
ncbi:MAG: glycosyltransferase [Planctomycetota bacterium]|nr:glycosyltransferase [Planctomycetota bacterium]